MNLIELKERATSAVEYARECEQDPSKIEVSLQIDGPEDESTFSSDNIVLHYDNNCCASGCVLTATVDLMIDYENLVEAIRKSPGTQLPGLLAEVVKECAKKKIFMDGKISIYVGQVENKYYELQNDK